MTQPLLFDNPPPHTIPAQRQQSRLSVLEELPGKKVRCRCSCGAEIVAKKWNVETGHTRSCGCLSKEVAAAAVRAMNTKHGKHRTPVWLAWRNMHDRCRNDKNTAYHNYGGRGIRVCERWSDFSAFFTDMGEPTSDDHSLDRINVNGNYEPGNCRWATVTEQQRNRRDTRFVTAFGETKSAADWAEDSRCKVSRDRIYYRLDRGWSPEAAIATPPLSNATRKGLIRQCGERDGSTIWRVV